MREDDCNVHNKFDEPVLIRINNSDIALDTRINLNFVSAYSRAYAQNVESNKEFICYLIYFLLSEEQQTEIDITVIRELNDTTLIYVAQRFLDANARLRTLPGIDNEESVESPIDQFIQALKVYQYTWADKFTQQLQPLVSKWTNWWEKVTQEFCTLGNSIVFEFEKFNDFLAECAKRVIPFIDSSQYIIEKFPFVILQFGWPPHQNISIESSRRIIEQYEILGVNRAKEIVDTIMLEEYNSEAIREMQVNWMVNIFLKNRNHILQDAVNAHFQGLYTLSIPTIFPQIEGIIAEFFSHKGPMTGRDLQEYFNRLLDNSSSTSFDTGIQDFILKIVLAKFKHGEPIGSDLSRHAILHGADISYGTEVNSLKTILLFDYIQDAIITNSKETELSFIT